MGEGEAGGTGEGRENRGEVTSAIIHPYFLFMNFASDKLVTGGINNSAPV